VKLGDTFSGVTAHTMTDKFDSGNVLLQQSLPITEDHTWGQVEHCLVPVVESVTGQVLQALHGEATLADIPQRGATCLMPPLRGDLLNVSWHATGEELRRTCYAIRPKSGARASFAGKPICIWNVRLETGSSDRPPGMIIGSDASGHPRVVVGNDVVVITEMLYNYRVRPGSLLLSWGMVRVGGRFDVGGE